MANQQNFNNLKDEKSGYLLAHSTNPVNWYPFCLEAIKLAQDKNKPLFISIGYQANHLSDLMNEESFQDSETAKALNENFVCIKIDKDECPDLSLYYQLSSQVSSNIGGWPLNVFAFADLTPFYATTYLPAKSEDSSKEFKNIAQGFSEVFKSNKKELVDNANNIQEILSKKPRANEKMDFQGHFPLPAALLNAIKDYQDNENGGYGAAPKLSNLSFYEYAIEQVLEGMLPEEQVAHVVKSVESMLMGGIYDHAKGGIHPFSRDEKWQIPHFEKTLYDQAALLRLLIKTSLIYPSPLVYDSIIQTIDYLETEMLSEDNFFFNAQGSASEGVDGLYFTFSQEEFIDAIAEHDEDLMDDIEFLEKVFKITDKGNYTNALNIITLNSQMKDDIYLPENWDKIRKAKMALMEARKNRIPPKTDSKGIATFNFQVLASLIDVIQYSNIEIISKSAFELLSKTFDDIHKTFIVPNESGINSIKNATTSARTTPLFENYVTLLDLSLRFYEISGSTKFLESSKEMIPFIFDHFYKDANFYVSSLHTKEDQNLNIHTPIFDQPSRSVLSTFIFIYRKWGKILDDNKYASKLSPVIEELTHLSLQNPLAFGETLRALTYPDEAFKIIQIPLKWIEEDKIQHFYPRFSSRFAITYSDEQKWSISNLKVVELSGSDFNSFKDTFKNEQ